MDALEMLINRRSASRLTEPTPAGEVLDLLLRTDMRAPDHGALKPCHFIIDGKGRIRLSELLIRSMINAGMNPKSIGKAKQAPFLAPLIITVVAYCNSQSNVPYWKQTVSAGCAVHAMQITVLAQGFNSMAHRHLERAAGRTCHLRLSRAG